MLSLWIHIRAFFAVVVVGCAQPVNWAQCVRVDQWLLPEVVQGYKLWTGQEKIYEKEEQYLNSLEDLSE
ncbi:hypothetical protein W1080910_166 [Cyanophage S-RIM12 isolate W1_08_0910]|uniref:Uncharacterized protein n=3 Tax=Brizovirus TaxID=2733098 RepID=A0A1D7SP25_9CAUD|nr:hypothetical protein HOQ65_gp070 [Cyanophage S-RIM12 isolate RW_06_0310]YP_009779575.1 hypothetical protein HOQ66_gp070 [Cyanophage S-RIM12 isolate W1_08_0910]AOO15438.1 hypothetical protein Np150310_164 [Cyanophage S-RIM12_Np_15_0310]AOO16078.1 hypothetical protein RW040310_164 [Cyanophage S-RIM12_RW_04_0310]AOO17588.1 hypothetical protein RW270310_169 [Cyanophage S-RIM12]AOO19298.1 hypothetical protein WH050310_164 [Cyanophage S-RIM12_WH_05_0310]AOO16508.1 hypothetical protein RW060310_1